MLIGARALQGLGGAMIFGTGVAILTSVFPPGERGRALGINVAGVYTGLSLGPVIGGWSSSTPRAGAAVFLAQRVPRGRDRAGRPLPAAREWADARGERFDVAGVARLRRSAWSR